MEVEFVMRSLLFNDMYKFSEGDYEMMYEDVDMEFWLWLSVLGFGGSL